jgi:hypothetical protein
MRRGTEISTPSTPYFWFPPVLLGQNIVDKAAVWVQINESTVDKSSGISPLR